MNRGEINKSLFKERLGEIQDDFKRLGVVYRIVGSIALSSYINKELDFDRPSAFSLDQRLPDIDLIVPRNNYAVARKLHKKHMKNTFPIFLGVTPAMTEIDFRPDEPVSYLRHREINTSIPSIAFSGVEKNFDLGTITTVN